MKCAGPCYLAASNVRNGRLDALEICNARLCEHLLFGVCDPRLANVR